VLRDVGEHLAEDRSLLHRLRAAPRLDELLGNDEAEFVGLGHGLLALNGDGVAVLADVASRIGLAGR